MAIGLTQFAAGGVDTTDTAWDPELSSDIIAYMEKESDFRSFVKTVTTDSYVIVLPRRWSSGIAVEVVEGSEIPKAHDVYDNISLNLRQNGTGIRMTDEAQKMMKFDQNYWQTEARRATERMLKKENKDIAEVLFAGAGIVAQTSASTTSLQFEDIVDLKATMEESDYGVSPDIMLISPRRYADLVKDNKFYSYMISGKSGVLESGNVGEYVAGLRIIQIPEVGDNVFLIDSSQEPIWLVQMGTMNTESYRIPETREDALDLTLYEKPAVLRPDAIARLIIPSATLKSQTNVPYGTDPFGLEKAPYEVNASQMTNADTVTKDSDGNIPKVNVPVTSH